MNEQQDEGHFSTIIIKNIEKRDDLDSILLQFNHDIDDDEITMTSKDMASFKKELRKKKIKL